MGKIKTAIDLLLHDPKLFMAQLIHDYPFLLSDRMYIKVVYWLRMGKKLDLENPRLFTEKIQWLKLYDRNPFYSTLVDKYEVKNYIAKKIDDKHIVKTIGVWDRIKDIKWGELPEKFVLKTTHGGGGGGVILVRDKSKIDIPTIETKLRKSMKQKIYEYNREWPYKNVKPRIIAEEFLEPKTLGVNSDLVDYKFYCFDGTPYYCQVIRNRSTIETIDFYDMEWNLMPFVGLNPKCENAITPMSKPKGLDVMNNLCHKLSSGLAFARIDLYDIDDNIYFGEITLYPSGGYGRFKPQEWDSKLGELLILPNKNQRLYENFSNNTNI